MFKVHTPKSNLLIKKIHFVDIIRKLKVFFKTDDQVQKSNNMYFLLRKFGWRIKIDIKTGDIISLIYASDDWNSKANSSLIVLCKHVEPGGYTQVINDKIQKYYVYKFDGKWFQRTPLTRVFVDLDSKSEVLTFLNQAIEAGIRKGLSKDDVISMYNKKLLNEYI